MGFNSGFKGLNNAALTTQSIQHRKNCRIYMMMMIYIYIYIERERERERERTESKMGRSKNAACNENPL